MEINTKQLKNSLGKVMGLNGNLCGKSNFHLEGKAAWLGSILLQLIKKLPSTLLFEENMGKKMIFPSLSNT